MQQIDGFRWIFIPIFTSDFSYKKYQLLAKLFSVFRAVQYISGNLLPWSIFVVHVSASHPITEGGQCPFS